jgi:hypothetical protein
MALAHWMAQKAIKAQWQRQGRRWQYVEPSELHQAARQYLVEHREELIADATAMLGHLTKLRSAAQKRNRSETGTSSVHMSCT